MAVLVTVGSAIDADSGSGLDSSRDTLWVEGSLTLSGSYGTGSSHGDTMNLASAFVASDYSPKSVSIYQEPAAGSAPLAYSFLYGRGTTPANGVLIVVDGSGVEITEGASYPGPLTDGAVIRFIARFAKNI